jgi:hypothetical protein
MSRRKYEAIPIRPRRVRRIVPEQLAIEYGAQFSGPHGQPWMAGVRFLNRVNRKRADTQRDLF